MPGSSILPVAIHNNKLYFLFGKENSLEDSAPGFSDFGGGIEKGESAFETAIREGSEELTGFLGTPSQLKRHINKTGGTYAFTHTNPTNSAKQYTVHIINYAYDQILPVYYNNNHRFLWDRMNRKFLKSTKLFEKIEIEWFCEDELRKRMREYRPFYREVVGTLLQKLPEIRAFITPLHIEKTQCNKIATFPVRSRREKSAGNGRFSKIHTNSVSKNRKQNRTKKYSGKKQIKMRGG